MAVLIGSSDGAQYATTTNTYAVSNGEQFYAITAAISGSASTLKIRINTFNTTTQLSLRVRDSAGNLLASGNVASGTNGERSVSVTPFNVVAGQSYLVCISPNAGSPNLFQSTTTGIFGQTGSTFAAPQDPIALPGTSLSAVRRFHMWVEGDETASQSITNVNGGEPVKPSVPATWAATGFSPAPNVATLDGIACTAVSGAGFTPPSIVDEQAAPRPGNRTLAATNSAAQSASATVPVGVMDGYDYVVLAGTLNTGNYSILQNMNPPAAEGDFIVKPIADNVLPTGEFESNEDGDRIHWHVQNSTKIWRSYVVTTGDNGEVIVKRFAKPLTAKTLTAKALTGRSL